MLFTSAPAKGDGYWGGIISWLSIAVSECTEMDGAENERISAEHCVAFMTSLQKAIEAAENPPKGWGSVKGIVSAAIRPVLAFAESALKFQSGLSQSNPVATENRRLKAQRALSAFPLRMAKARARAAELQRSAGGLRAEIISLHDAVELMRSSNIAS